MGIYLNSLAAYTLYKNESKKTYFVDKTSILEELFPLVEEGNHYICITRPRRFGKTVTANLIASFFSKGCDASDVFDRLKVSGNQEYRRKMNQYNVIHISLNEVPKRCVTYEQYIQRIEARLIKDLKQAYPDADVNGYVTYPNVSVVTEMTNLIDASRSFEANATAFSASKAIAVKGLEMSQQ